MPISSSGEDNPSRSKHGDPNPLGPFHHLCPDDFQPAMLANQSTSPMVCGPAEAHPPTLQNEEAPIPSALGPCTPAPEAEKPSLRHKKRPRALDCAAAGPEKNHPPNRSTESLSDDSEIRVAIS